jgi:hypothetical protein
MTTLAATVMPLPRPDSGSRVNLRAAHGPAVASVPESLVASAAARDLFRSSRRPADTRYDPHRQEQLMAAPAGVPKPALRLVGFVAGSPPVALLDGIPGIDGGRAVRQGDTVGSLRIVRVADGAVRVVGLDTTWTLHVAHP